MKTETLILKEKLEIFVNTWVTDKFKNTEGNRNYRRVIRKLDDIAMTATLYFDEHSYKDEEVIASYLFRDGKITDLTKSRRSKTRVIETYLL